jgi:DNA repair exonuclease SbcCD ATPase subunit
LLANALFANWRNVSKRIESDSQMTNDRIDKIKSAVESAENIPANKKAELLRLLSKLQPAIAKVSETHHEHAQSIARLVEASTHEATRAKKKPQMTKTPLHELKQSVENFEASHPELVALVTEYSALLAALGI